MPASPARAALSAHRRYVRAVERAEAALLDRNAAVRDLVAAGWTYRRIAEYLSERGAPVTEDALRKYLHRSIHGREPHSRPEPVAS